MGEEVLEVGEFRLGEEFGEDGASSEAVYHRVLVRVVGPFGPLGPSAFPVGEHEVIPQCDDPEDRGGD